MKPTADFAPKIFVWTLRRSQFALQIQVLWQMLSHDLHPTFSTARDDLEGTIFIMISPPFPRKFLMAPLVRAFHRGEFTLIAAPLSRTVILVRVVVFTNHDFRYFIAFGQREGVSGELSGPPG